MRIIFFIALLICFSKNALATELPTISVTLYLVSENEACKPNGYVSYGDEKPSNCDKLKLEDIEGWKDEHTIRVRKDIPPSEISLGDDFLISLDQYRTASKLGPSERKSIVLVFDWRAPQTIKFSFQRKGKNSSIPNANWNGNLENESHWIHHERADAFFPSHNMKWELVEDGHTWLIKTAR